MDLRLERPEVFARDGIATHIKKFWEPRMREAIFAHLDNGGEGLDPNVRKAIETLKPAPINS